MKRSSEYLSSELLPRKLTAKEVADPRQVIDDFFDYASLPQVRDKLFAWFEITVVGNFHKGLRRQERQDLLLFYSQLEKLIEASHVLLAETNGKKVSGT